MAVLLFRLQNVSSDEADDVRALLEQHELAFYETSAGTWGLAVAAIWLVNDEDEQQARRLLDDYQHQRAMRVKAEHAGNAETFIQRLFQRPVRMLALLLMAAAIAYVSLMPFIRLQ